MVTEWVYAGFPCHHMAWSQDTAHALTTTWTPLMTISLFNRDESKASPDTQVAVDPLTLQVPR